MKCCCLRGTPELERQAQPEHAAFRVIRMRGKGCLERTMAKLPSTRQHRAICEWLAAVSFVALWVGLTYSQVSADDGH